MRTNRDDVLYYAPQTLPPTLAGALELVGPELGLVPVATASQKQAQLRIAQQTDQPGFYWDGNQLQLHGQTVAHWLRSLAGWRGKKRLGMPADKHVEQAYFDQLGVMIDASRNAVPKVETLQYLLRRLALMGFNQLYLYIEDTYTIADEPYFGYMRGRYTPEELKAIDDYAARLGIEVIACIQTLGHLRQILQWPAYDHIKDTDSVLLVDEPASYELIGKMIASVLDSLRSRTVHVGMDEAHDLGMGRYLERHGLQPRFDLMNRHLQRVAAICAQHGGKPMIWSDMYFRLGSQRGDYYDRDLKLPPGLAEQIPPQVELVYWDYYHSDESFYEQWIDLHRTLGKEPIFAGGLWTWQTFWQNYSLAGINTDAAMRACKRKQIRRAMITQWGDDGAEVELLSILPGLQHFAQHAYADEPTLKDLQYQFQGSVNAQWDQWALPRQIDQVPCRMTLRQAGGQQITPGNEHLADRDDINWNATNPSKFLLWQDPLLGLFDAHLPPGVLGAHYARLAAALKNTQPQPGELWPVEVIRLLAVVLADKAELGINLIHAYQQRDRAALKQIMDDTLPALLTNTEALRQAHAQRWLTLHKPFGWEILDRRYGGLLARLESARQRIAGYLDGTYDSLEELEIQRLPVRPWPAGKVGYSGRHRQIISATAVG